MGKVIIVGAGIIGLSAAYELSKKGFSVEVVDRETPGEGCSYGNAGMLVPSHFITLPAPGVVAKALRWMTYSTSPFSVRPSLKQEYLVFLWKFYRHCNREHVEKHMELLLNMHLQSRNIFLAWKDELPSFGLQTKGITMLYNSAKGEQEEKNLSERANELGIATKVFNRFQLLELEPGLNIEATGGVHYELDAHLDPALLMKILRSELIKRGVVFRDHTSVTSLTYNREMVTGLNTENGSLTGDYFIVAAGAWSQHLLKPLGITIPMQTGKGYSLDFPDPDHLFKVPKLINEEKVTVTPVGDFVRFGGTMQIGDYSSRVHRGKMRGILTAVSHYFPEFPIDKPVNPQPWTGLRPLSPDGLPYIGPVKKYPNMVVATGHSMLGISLAAVTGKLVSGIIAGEDPVVPIQAMNPERFCR